MSSGPPSFATTSCASARQFLGGAGRLLFVVSGALAAMVAVGACAGGTPVRDAPSVAAPRWPAAPEPARVVWTRAISRPSDIGVRPSMLRRAWRALTGGHEPHLLQPFGVALADDGRIFVSDLGTHSVHVFDELRGRYEEISAVDGVGFRAPTGVAVGADATLYVGDATLGTVVALDARRRARWRAAGLERPTGIAWARGTGLVYVVETQAHRVRALDAQGRSRLVIGGRGDGPGQFNYPTQICIDADGSLWVTDALNFRVQHFTADGRFLGAFGRAGDHEGDFARPKGIAVDTDGHLYVVDGLYDVINIFRRDGEHLLTVGGAGRQAGQFWLANGLAIDARNRMVVADAFNHRIQMLQYVGAP